jgi:hypothetical protein
MSQRHISAAAMCWTLALRGYNAGIAVVVEPIGWSPFAVVGSWLIVASGMCRTCDAASGGATGQGG